MELKLIENYVSKLSLVDTEVAIKDLKDFFERSLSQNLNLLRVSAPLFVESKTGLNDDLNGFERPIGFKAQDKADLQIVQSLAKWKRFALKMYDIDLNKGIYTDMNAIRQDEHLSPIHSYYVDQWDWELNIDYRDRNLEYLKKVVNKIYHTLKNTDDYIAKKYRLSKKLPSDITFITSEELLQKYPTLSPKEREYMAAKKYGAIFIIGIGHKLSNDERHDGRAPDYDDWNLNGDIIFYNKVLDIPFEISSMGIRVCKDSLMKQLTLSQQLWKKDLPFHQSIFKDEIPYSIGGGIGQSRLCMFFLEKAHIGEVQASYWDEKTRNWAIVNKINLL